eukprot:1156379-Pelagomonas_calceolata.AAC.2
MTWTHLLSNHKTTKQLHHKKQQFTGWFSQIPTATKTNLADWRNGNTRENQHVCQKQSHPAEKAAAEAADSGSCRAAHAEAASAAAAAAAWEGRPAGACP